MKRRHIAWLALALSGVGLGLGLGIIVGRQPEPAYEGKSLGRLLADLVSVESDAEAREFAATAIRQLGTNCIPTLLTLLQQREHPLTTRTKWLIMRYGPEWVRFSDAADKRVRGMAGFEVLGPIAGSATPALSNLLQQPDISWQVAWALGALGEGGVEALVQTLTNSQKHVRLASICALGHWGTNAFAAEAFTQLLTNEDYEIRRVTAESVGHLGAAGAGVVPGLAKGLEDTNAEIRAVCARSLGWIGPQAHQAVPALLEARTNNDWRFAESVRYALFQICSNSEARTRSK